MNDLKDRYKNPKEQSIIEKHWSKLGLTDYRKKTQYSLEK